jgi:AAA ATPase domain
MEERHQVVGRDASELVGRRWEMSAVEGLLDRAINGHGTVVGVVGPPGIGKSRLVREVSAMASARKVEVFTAFCESHTSQIPFHAVARLLRATTGVEGLDAQSARERVRAQVTDANPEDLMLLDDLLAIADPDVVLPKVDPDARRRRLTALVKSASLPSQIPAVHVVEDTHWIDEASESMLADLLTVIPQTRSLVLITYRPEYRGRLTQSPGAQAISLAPLSDTDTTSLVSQLLGPDPSVRRLGQLIAERAAGNPFFAEELARELAERGVLRGERGAYVSTAETAEVTVPATLQATIAARIDRLNPADKHTLSAAAVIGSRFSCDLLIDLGVDPSVHELINAELIDQVRFTPRAEYAFRHPLIRAVAYEAQLKADRVKLHRRLAAAIEAGEPESTEKNAALVAEHLEAAGDARAAYAWHMRAGEWSITRDIRAAIKSWERAGQLADTLPNEDGSTNAMRIVPRGLLCANAFRVKRGDSAARFSELHELCGAAGDKATLAVGMVGLLADTLDECRVREASQLASQHLNLLESIGDATLTVGLGFIGVLVKALSAEMADAQRWSQLTIDLADGDPTMGNFVVGSPLALAMGTRGVARYWLGLPGWREDLDHSFAWARTADAWTWATVLAYKYDLALFTGVVRSDDSALREIGEALQTCEQSGDDFALAQARMSMGFALIHHDTADSDRGVALLKRVRDQILQGEFSLAEVPLLNMYIAREQARLGDPDGVLASMRESADQLFSWRHNTYSLVATSILVETLLQAGNDDHLSEAEMAIDRLSMSGEEQLPVRDIMVLRLRTLLAKARKEDTAYRDLRERYRAMANSLGYEGHIAWAEAMP